MISTIFSLLFILFIAVLLISTAYAAASFAPPVPMWTKDQQRIFELASLRPGETFYDLGCGDGKMVLYAAQHFDVQAKGVELALPFYIVCQIRKLLQRRKNVHFYFGNLFRHDISDADVIYIFGLPAAIQKKLKVKLEKELKKGARVISCAFAISDWDPVTISKPNPKDISIYLYQR